MYPIYLFNNKNKSNIGLNINDFEKQFKKICEEHKKTNKARIFAFILTDFKTMEANHFVLNHIYWNDLHTKSSDFLTIFHLDFQSEKVNRLFREDKTKFVKNKFEDFYISLTKIFDTEELSLIKTPAILFFQTQSSDITDLFYIELDSKKLQENMNNLRSYIEAASNAVKDVTKENLNNSYEIFKLLESAIKSERSKIIMKTFIKKAIPLINLIK